MLVRNRKDPGIPRNAPDCVLAPNRNKLKQFLLVTEDVVRGVDTLGIPVLRLAILYPYVKHLVDHSEFPVNEMHTNKHGITAVIGFGMDWTSFWM